MYLFLIKEDVRQENIEYFNPEFYEEIEKAIYKFNNYLSWEVVRDCEEFYEIDIFWEKWDKELDYNEPYILRGFEPYFQRESETYFEEEFELKWLDKYLEDQKKKELS